MLREKWWNCRWAAAVLMLQKSPRPSSTGSASHWRVKCAFMKDCKSQIKSHTCLLDLYLMWKVHFLKMCHVFYRFMHKHPEDPTEVPNGFLSDINPVSTPAHSTCLDSPTWISNMFFFSLELSANNQQCLSRYFSQGSKGFGQIPIWKGRLLFCGPRQHRRKGKEDKSYSPSSMKYFTFYFIQRVVWV